MKIILKISSQKFGNIKKINSSLQRKQNLKQQNMLRIKLHIETAGCFSPKGYDNNAGACYAYK